MVRNMNKTYTSIINDPNAKSKNINVGGYYVTLIDDDFVRTRILEVNDEKNEINCFLIDFGDELIVPKEKIYEIKREFAKDQAQVICKLFSKKHSYRFV